MKLYSYSYELHTLVVLKWAIAKFVFGGVLIGVILFLGVIQLNLSAGNVVESHRIKTLTADNTMMRQQLQLILPRVKEIEMQVRPLHEDANMLPLLFPRYMSVKNTASIFANAINGLKFQPFISATKNISR